MADDSEQSSAPPVPPQPATVGELLRAARLTQDLTVEQLSTELRIEAKQLQALENNRFEQIGVPVFVKGYLKQYGTRLGINVSDLLALYYKQTTLADIQIQPSRTIKLHDERQIASWVVAVILLLAVAGALAWWWTDGTFAIPTSTPAAAPAPAVADQPTPAPSPTPAPAVAPREPLPAVDPPPPAVEPSSEQASPPAVPAVAAVDPAANDSLAAPVVAIPLQFAFEQESWAEVTDARGERLLFGLNPAGRNVTVSGEPPFAIVLGNADSVRLVVDGAPYAIPTVGRQGNLVRFAVDIAEE